MINSRSVVVFGCFIILLLFSVERRGGEKEERRRGSRMSENLHRRICGVWYSIYSLFSALGPQTRFLVLFRCLLVFFVFSVCFLWLIDWDGFANTSFLHLEWLYRYILYISRDIHVCERNLSSNLRCCWNRDDLYSNHWFNDLIDKYK